MHSVCVYTMYNIIYIIYNLYMCAYSLKRDFEKLITKV